MCIMHVGGSAKDGVLRQPNPLSYPFILPHETWTISIFVADFSRRIVYMHDEFFQKWPTLRSRSTVLNHFFDSNRIHNTCQYHLHALRVLFHSWAV